MPDVFIGGKRVKETGEQAIANYVWDTVGLAWIAQTASSGGGGPTADVNVTNASLAVTGAFYQATQPVSGPLTDAQLRALAVPVSGTFWPTTQPVSGTFWQATQPVSGTFWQATQPVSGPLTDTQLRATAVPVSGTFWQATQPMSAVSLPLPTGAATETTLAALGVTVTRPTTGGRSTVAAAAADTLLLAANAARKGMTVYNEGSTVLYLALGTAAASATSYTCQVAAGGYYEAPFEYTGQVRGIWAGAPTGNARITELT